MLSHGAVMDTLKGAIRLGCRVATMAGKAGKAGMAGMAGKAGNQYLIQ